MSLPGSTNEQRAILMIAIGSRPWSIVTSELFRDYAARCGAAFILQNDLPSEQDFSLPALPDKPGRAHKRVYASKAYLPWRLLEQEGYDRVLVVDDSCCVKQDAPDIFELVKPGACGFTETSHAHAELSFKEIRKFLKARGEPDIPYVPEHYMNSGVMLYTKPMAKALAPERILEASDMLFAAYPHQTLTYYLLNSANVPLTTLPKAFNRLPAADLPPAEWAGMTDVTPYIGDHDDTYIYHVTGAFKRRDVLIPSLALHLLAQSDPQKAQALSAAMPAPASASPDPGTASPVTAAKRTLRRLASMLPVIGRDR